MTDVGEKGEDLRLQGQVSQELSGTTGPNQLILQMSSEYQTVDHTNTTMGNEQVRRILHLHVVTSISERYEAQLMIVVDSPGVIKD